MDIIKILETRYTTKEYDNTKKLTEEQLSQIEKLLQLSPSSTNSQPWGFIVATTDEGKKRIAKAAQGEFNSNESKILNASAVIIFASRVNICCNYLNKLLEKEELDGRFDNDEAKEMMKNARNKFSKMHKFDFKDIAHWTEKQVYLNAGNFLLGVASMGLDATPIEGVDFKVLNNEFNLPDKGLTASLVVSVGYHKDTDFNATLPKSRLDIDDIITRV